MTARPYLRTHDLALAGHISMSGHAGRLAESRSPTAAVVKPAAPSGRVRPPHKRMQSR
jgi:hypothetical protein